MSNIVTVNNFTNLTDVDLVQSSLKNKDNFYFLMKRYEPRLTRYINRITNIGQDDKDDLLQDIFIKVYRNLNGFDQNLKFSSWIYRIAHNEIINQYHKKSRSKLLLNIDKDDLNSVTSILKDEADISEEFLSQEKVGHVKIVLSKLPLKYQEVLLLHFFEEKSYKEISDILKKPMGTIATLINRAKLKFEKHYHQFD
jgi:RNA polymerase sigma-70 factor, ECF subfamily